MRDSYPNALTLVVLKQEFSRKIFNIIAADAMFMVLPGHMQP